MPEKKSGIKIEPAEKVEKIESPEDEKPPVHKKKPKEKKPKEAPKEEPKPEPVKHLEPKEGVELAGKKENPLMKREEISIMIYHSGKPTPNRESILETVSGLLKANKDLIIIDRVYSKSGMAATETKVLLYKKKEDIPQGKLDKMKKKKKPKEEAKQPEAKEEEKPTVKEEKKEPEKPKEERPPAEEKKQKEPEKKPEKPEVKKEAPQPA